MKQPTVIADLKCYHCGQVCEDETHWLDDKAFCCFGCKTVYEILSSNNLCAYYDLDSHPGNTVKDNHDETYAYLDDATIRKKILDFDSETFARVTFFIPNIHCISCIWLLDHLHKIEKGILRSESNFAKKTVVIHFNPGITSLSTIARLLASLGYAPRITLENEIQKNEKPVNRSLLLKLAVAGFCFGNVMLFSFPEYLGIDHSEKDLARLFSWLNLVLSIPVFFYSGFDYIQSAAKSFRLKQINIDVPIAAGLIALLLRSAYDIITGTGPGYLDSFTGLVFFLLIGRWFQNKTYESLAFDRNFASYFPLAVNTWRQGKWKPVILYKLKRGDRIRIRNMEIVPADSTLLHTSAYIDYSFVTGESRPVKVPAGGLVYAGGKLIGSPVELQVEKETSQSHLTSLWNDSAFKKPKESRYRKVIDRAAQKFTWAVLGIATLTAIYWQLTNPSEMWLVLTAVLMVACPCALALSAPFTLGNMLRVFGKNKLYLKNADVIERMATIDTVVFDKTGTVTHGQEPEISLTGNFSEQDLNRIRVLTGFSTHPLSVLIHRHLLPGVEEPVTDFSELPGKGLTGNIGGHAFKIGSASFTGYPADNPGGASRVYITIDNEAKGYFTIRTSVRENFGEMIRRMKGAELALVSGDQDTEKNAMRELFGPDVPLLFNQNPHEKLQYIKGLQSQGKKVMMVGDGLNDAGALKQSDVGIAVTDDTGVFTPACDGILDGRAIGSLDKLISFARSSSVILKIAFVISFLYNAIALGFAVTGKLTPLIAAVIMPLSSISVVTFATLAVKVSASQHKL